MLFQEILTDGLLCNQYLKDLHYDHSNIVA
jgi:hypothetical protein